MKCGNCGKECGYKFFCSPECKAEFRVMNYIRGSKNG